MSPAIAKEKTVLGLDIGGANIKAANRFGDTRHLPFALWKNPAGLGDALRTLLAGMPAHNRLAVTMTGELCDCFASRREGVCGILDAVASAAGSVPVRVWTTDGQFVDLTAARAQPLKVASANWLGLATLAGTMAPKGAVLLIDIGTTTTDIIPLVDGRPVPEGRTDKERLENGELVYRGWRRTPLCVLMDDGAAEFFATTHDLSLVLEMVPEEPSDRDTADGQPATLLNAHRRLARMMGADLETSTHEERKRLATILNLRLVSAIALAINTVVRRLPSPPCGILASGSGEFLLKMVLRAPGYKAINAPVESLARILSPAISAAACAYAVAVLCGEREVQIPG